VSGKLPHEPKTIIKGDTWGEKLNSKQMPKMHTANADKPVVFYNLDVILCQDKDMG